MDARWDALVALENQATAIRTQLDLREQDADASAAEIDALRDAEERTNAQIAAAAEAIEAARRAAPPMAGFVRAAPAPDDDASDGEGDDDDDGGGAPRAAGGGDVAAMYRDLVGAPPEKPPIPTVSRDVVCGVCGVTYDRAQQARHESSVAHTLSLKFRPRTRRVALPDGNVGAQLLDRMGWRDDGERPGLGAAGREGRVQPLPVALKRDTTGLGAKAYEKRVSHFRARDKAATAHPRAARPRPAPAPAKTQGVKRKDARRAEAATKRRDANLRRDLGDRDIPEGYEALFR